MANKKIYKRRRKSRKNYSISERKSYRNGFFAGLFASKKNNRFLRKKSGNRTVNDIPKNYRHNVLFSDERYKNIYGHYSRELGFEHEKARDYALQMYRKEYGDSVLKKHYNIT